MVLKYFNDLENSSRAKQWLRSNKAARWWKKSYSQCFRPNVHLNDSTWLKPVTQWEPLEVCGVTRAPGRTEWGPEWFRGKGSCRRLLTIPPQDHLHKALEVHFLLVELVEEGEHTPLWGKGVCSVCDKKGGEKIMFSFRIYSQYTDVYF